MDKQRLQITAITMNYICQRQIIINKFSRDIKSIRRRYKQRIRQRIFQNTTHYLSNMKLNVELMMVGIPKSRERTIWKKERSRHWWEKIFNSSRFDEMFENFRMNQDTFKYICEKVRGKLKCSKKCYRDTISVEMKVAIGVFKLASCAEYRVAGNQFGVHKSTVQKCVYEFCEARIKVLLKAEVHMPDDNEIDVLINAFEAKCGISNIIGALDGAHIPIKPTVEGYRDYVNRKGWPSLVVQAVVDNSYLFHDITVKHAGCSHDAAVLKDSYLFKNKKIEQIKRPVNNVMLPVCLVGDPAYPLLPWLMKGYSLGRTPEEEHFTTNLNKARIVVEHAFGRLKGRWRILQKRIDIDVSFVPKIVAACCILHNIIERRKLPYSTTWNEEIDRSSISLPQPNTAGTQETSIDGEYVRELLKRKFFASDDTVLLS